MGGEPPSSESGRGAQGRKVQVGIEKGDAAVKLSADRTSRIKVLFPLIYFASFVPFVFAYLSGRTGAPTGPGLALLAGMALLGLYAMKNFLWDLADEVYDQGDALLVRRRNHEEVVALANVQDVTFANMRPPRLTLHLIKPGGFGARVSFTPASKRLRNPFAKHPMMQELAVRAWRARNGGADTEA